MEEKSTEVSSQTVEIPLKPGSRLTLLKNPDIDEDGGVAADVMYEATVEKYVPETGLLKMSDGTGLCELRKMIEEAEGYEVFEQ